MMKTKLLFVALLGLIGAMSVSCEKDAHNKPNIQFKTGAGYVYKDTTLPMNTQIKVGVNITKTEDDLKTYSFSIAYDGGALNTTNSHSMTGSGEKTSYSNDEVVTTRNQAGSEKYQFTVTDADGNIALINCTVTVK